MHLHNVMKRDVVSNRLTISDLREGDILVMLGNSLASTVVCCCLRSWGSSHVGQVMRLDGEMWLAESTPHSDFKQLLVPGREPVYDGVSATKIEDSFCYYNAIDVYRPIGISSTELQIMRSEFLRLYASPYKHVVNKLMSRCCVGCDENAQYTYDCSDLIYHLFDKIGRINRDVRVRKELVRPYDITRLISCDRVGHVDGVYAIGDPRSWCTCGKTARNSTIVIHLGDGDASTASDVAHPAVVARFEHARNGACVRS